MVEAPLTTGVDALIDLVNERRTVAFADAAAALKVPLVTIEAWAGFLEEEGVLKVQYSLTKPFLVAVAPATAKEPAVAVTIRTGRKPVRPVAPDGAIDRETVRDVDLLDQARDALANGDIATAKAIYAQLEDDYRHFPEHVEASKDALVKTLSTLNEAFLTGVSKQDDASQKLAATVREHIAQAQTAIGKGQVDEAVNAFVKANAQYAQLPADATELRLSLHPLLSQTQQSLVDAELHRASKDWGAQLQRVATLLDALQQAIDAKQLDKAFALYDQLDAAKKALPPALSDRKSELEHKLLPAYETLINLHVDLARKELRQKLDVLRSIGVQIDAALSSQDATRAIHLYNMAKRAYISIPNEFFEQKVESQKLLLAHAKSINQLELADQQRQLADKLDVIKILAEDAIHQIGRGNIEGAHHAYADAVNAFAILPKGFLDQKAPVQQLLVALYSNLLKDGTRPVQPVATSSIGAFAEGVKVYRDALRRADWTRAIAAYDSLSALSVVPSQYVDDYSIMREQVTLLSQAMRLSTLRDPALIKATLHPLYLRYQELRQAHPQEGPFFGYVRGIYLAALAQIETGPTARPTSRKQKAAPRSKTPGAKQPAARPATPVPAETTPFFEPATPAVASEAMAAPPRQEPRPPADAEKAWALAIDGWRDALRAGQWDLALEIVRMTESLPPAPQDKAHEVAIILEQAALLREAHMLEEYAGMGMLKPALERFHASYTGIVGRHPGETLLYGHLKSLYVGALTTVRRQETPRPMERIAEEAPAPQAVAPASTSEAPTLAVPAQTPVTPAMSADDIWVEILSTWHEAIRAGQWDVALQVVEMFDSLGPAPQDRAFEVKTVIEQAELLREAHMLEEYAGMGMLKPALERFYTRYNEITKEHPADVLLYKHIRAIYTGALSTVRGASYA